MGRKRRKSRTTKRFEVRHEAGRRKFYTRRKLSELEKKATHWMNRKLEPTRTELYYWRKKLVEAKLKAAFRVHYPSNLDIYASTIEQCEIQLKMLENSFEYSRDLLYYFEFFKGVVGFSPREIGEAMRSLDESPRKETRVGHQLQIYRSYYRRTKRSWISFFRKLEGVVRHNTRFNQSANTLIRQRREARKRLERIQKEVDLKRGQLEINFQIGLISADKKDVETQKVLKPLFIAREKYFSLEQQWYSFWLKSVPLYEIFASKLPKAFKDELIRRREQAIEDTMRARRKSL